MNLNVTQKLIKSHLLMGELKPGNEIGIKIDQTLTQDATGTLVMLELEAMGLERIMTEVSVQYVDHNILQEDSKNSDDHLFLQSACEKFGIWFSRPGNGVSHPLHQEYFGKPGKTLLGSDSHTPAGGSLGMLAIGTGGLEVALAMAGEPYFVNMPQVWGIKLKGKLPRWVSAKDIILEMLRRHNVSGGVGKVIEYYGPGLENLSAMDRHVIANMGAELGATTTVFPSDEEVRRFLKSQDREADWIELKSDKNASYDLHEEIDLSKLEPLIAMPSSPGNVRKVSEVAGRKIGQAYIGSSANPSYRDFAIAAEMVKGKMVSEHVSFDVNPTSRQILENLVRDGHLANLIHSGARIHQAGCNGCIGMGQAPATHQLSLRTVPRNFPGRSGVIEDQVCLVSPETATASALTGVITDPRTLKMEYPVVRDPESPILNRQMFVAPLSTEKSRKVVLCKGPNIVEIPQLSPLTAEIILPALLKVQDNISTDAIMPAGAKVLPYRSNIPKLSEFVFYQIDPTYSQRAKTTGDHVVIAGLNYGQGSSREHAALAPRYLGLRIVIAKSFARIHWQNLINFGILPLTFSDVLDFDLISSGDMMEFHGLTSLTEKNHKMIVRNKTKNQNYNLEHQLSERQIQIILSGGLLNLINKKLNAGGLSE